MRAPAAFNLFSALAVSVVVAASAPAAAKAPARLAVAKAAAPVLVTSVEGITEYRLANGMGVLLFPDASKPDITVNITYLVGSRHESYGETGMAHLLEHLLFKGTPRHPDVPKVLNGLGARFNGTTSTDRTNYFVTFPASDENLRTALDLEADRMLNSNIARKDLDTEFSVVRNELEIGENNPRGVTLQRTLAAAFDWHNYGKSTIGARADIENVKIERLQAFYKRYYQPDNAVLLVAGKIDPRKTLALVDQYFGRVPRPARTLEPTYTIDPVQDGERSVTVRRTGDEKVLMLAYKIPQEADPDRAPVDVLTAVMANTPSGRLHKALVDTKKATGIFGFEPSSREPGAAIFMAQLLKDGNLDDVRQTAINVLESLAKQPITAAEVDRAKAHIAKEIDLMLNDINRLAIMMSNAIAAGDWRLLFLRRDRIKAVTVADVQRVALAYLKQSNRTVGQFIPTDRPDRARELRLMPDAEVAALVKDYKGQAAAAAGETFDATPAQIDARTERLTLPSGLKVALLAKKTRGEAVTAQLVLRLGSEETLQGNDGVGNVVAALLDRGAGKLSRQQIQDEMDRLKSRVMISGSGEAVRVMITTTRPNLEPALRLVATMLKEPTFAPDEFTKVINEEVSQAEQQRSDPMALAENALDRHLEPYPKGHTRYADTPDEAIALFRGFKLDDIKAFHKAFYGASAGQLAVVGDFDAAVIGKLSRELFGQWRAATPYKRIPDKSFDVAPLDRSIETPDKANAMFMAGLNLHLSDTDPDYPALLLANYLLGGSALKHRLGERLRQKEGVSYGVRSMVSASPFEKAGRFQSFAMYNPVNATRLEAGWRQEVARALKDGFTDEEIAAGKQSWLQGRAVGRAQDGELSMRLVSHLHIGRTMAFEADLEKRVAALGGAEIVAALRKYVEPSKLTIVKAGDFAKARSGGKAVAVPTAPAPPVNKASVAGPK